MAPGRVTDPLAVLCVFESNLLQFPRAVLDFGCLNKVIFTSPRMSYLPRRIPTCRRWVYRTTQPHVPPFTLTQAATSIFNVLRTCFIWPVPFLQPSSKMEPIG